VDCSSAVIVSPDGNPVKGGKAVIRVKATCKYGQHTIPCLCPYETMPNVHHLSKSVELPLSQTLKSLCSKGKKVRAPLIAVVQSSENTCSLSKQAKNAAKAGYKALILLGLGDVSTKPPSKRFAIPVVRVGREEWRASQTSEGAKVSINWQALKVEGALMKNGGDLFMEAQRMMAVSRFNEAAARFYLSNTLEPGFLPAKILMSSAQFLRDCSIQACDNDGFNFLPEKLTQWQKESITKIVQSSFQAQANDAVSQEEDIYANQKGCKEKPKKDDDNKLHVVAIARNGREEQVKLLKTSTAVHGINVDILGAGMNYVNSGTRFLLLSEYLTDMVGDDIVMFLDQDSIVQASAKVLMRRFRQMCAPMVFAAIKKCHPDPSLILLYPEATESLRFRFLNAAHFIGRVDAIRDMIERVMTDIQKQSTFLQPAVFRIEAADAGRWTTRYMFQNPGTIKLDATGSIFYSLENANASMFELKRRQVFPKGVHNAPLVLYKQGPDRQQVYRHVETLIRDTGIFERQDIF